MGKILAIAGLIVFVWWAVPFLAKGVWIAPTPVAPNTWMVNYLPVENRSLLATPPEGYGWSHFDFWNADHMTTPPSSVTQSDFYLKY